MVQNVRMYFTDFWTAVPKMTIYFNPQSFLTSFHQFLKITCILIVVLSTSTSIDAKVRAKTKVKANANTDTVKNPNTEKLLTDFEIHVLYKPYECHMLSDVGDTILIHYTAKFESGKIFEATMKMRKQPLEIKLGAGDVIDGLEKGLLGMCAGERRELVIPPHMAYGDEGKPPTIPAKATLRYDVQLIRLDKFPKFDFYNPINILSLMSVVVFILLLCARQYKAVDYRQKKKPKRRE